MDRPLARESSKVESPPLPAKRPSARNRREQALQLIETGIEIEPTRLLCAQRLERIVLSRPRGLFGGGVCFDSRLEIQRSQAQAQDRVEASPQRSFEAASRPPRVRRTCAATPDCCRSAPDVRDQAAPRAVRSAV